MSTGQNNVRLVGDVGGTNARFALVEGNGLPQQELTLSCGDFADLGEAIAFYLHEKGDIKPLEAAIAVATPITSDLIKFTNNDWQFSVEETRQRLGFARLIMLNDFTALAMSLPYLAADEIKQVGGGQPAANAAIGLIGPGTGLGVSGLVPYQDKWIPLQGEGGHVTFSPADARQLDILRVMQHMSPHISAERIISGFGLPGFYRAVAQLHGVEAEPLEPSEISNRALAGTDPVCVEVMEQFCAMLGTVAGNLALTLGARAGIYIGGGIVPKLGEYFERSGFRASFEAKGRFVDYMKAIPVFVILAKYPALLGASKAF